MLDSLFDSVLYNAVAKGMDAASMRQKVIANNIANVDTPHYKRVEVNFEDAFKQALEKNPKKLTGFRTANGHMPINQPADMKSVTPKMWRQNDSYSRADDNDVDMDVEMVSLAQNEIMMNSLVEIFNRKMTGLKTVIRGR